MAIGPREPIMEVVPLEERLLVEARINPDDIDHVRIGDDAEIRLTAYQYRQMPLLVGKVTTVSADRLTDPQTGQSWYNVLIDVDVAKLAEIPGTRMQTGMAAEVFVTTPPRSLFDYMIRPLTNYASRGMREP
jgi:HlyD family secretion protein